MRTAPSGALCRRNLGLGVGRSDLHPLGSPGCLGAPAQPGAGAWDPAWDDVPRRHQRAGASEGRRSTSKRGSQAQRDHREALGRSRGGYGTKACVITDGLGRAVAFRPVRRTSCLTPFRCSTAYQVGLPRLWLIKAIEVTASANTSGASVRSWRSRAAWPVQTGSTTTAMSSRWSDHK
jgi:hypothetical protein